MLRRVCLGSAGRIQPQSQEIAMITNTTNPYRWHLWEGTSMSEEFCGKGAPEIQELQPQKGKRRPIFSALKESHLALSLSLSLSLSLCCKTCEMLMSQQLKLLQLGGLDFESTLRNLHVCLWISLNTISISLCLVLPPTLWNSELTYELCYIQVVPGQAGGGSFKFETLIAYRAEQRLCL